MSAVQANGQVSSEILAGAVTYPQSVIDSWPPANFVNPTLHPPTIIIYSAIFGSLALASTIGRLWSRFKVQGNGGIDDWVFMASLPFSFPLVFMTINACSRFFNKHSWDVEFKHVAMMAKLAWWLKLEYLLSSGFIKLSILLFYRRITQRAASRTFHTIVTIMIVFQVCTTTVWFFLTVFSCYPVATYWTRFDMITPPTGHYECPLDGEKPFIIMSGIALLQDFICATLPFLVLRHLKVTRRQKVALFCTFFIAFGICGVAVSRLYYIHLSFVSYDVAWYAYKLWQTSVIEVLVASTVSSVPALKFFFRHYFEGSKPEPVLDTIPTGTHNNYDLESEQITSSGTVRSGMRQVWSKARTKSQAFTSIISEVNSIAPSMSDDTIKTTSPVHAPSLDATATAATRLEAEWTADVAGLIERTASRQERELRKSGVIAKDQWEWDVSELQERTPSRQERQLRKDGIIKPDEWSSTWDIADLQGRTPSFIESRLRNSGILAKDQWSSWDGGKILLEGEDALESRLVADGILSSQAGLKDDSRDYFASFDMAGPALPVEGSPPR